MKNIILFSFVVFSIIVFSQTTDKTVTLVVSGQGKTQDEAKQNALRSAIEQAFGAFVSSKTEILNDSIVSDEIISLSSGNIVNFEIISEVKVPGGIYATTLKAMVSVTKLSGFCQSKGVVIEFNGGIYASNAKLENLNSEAELKTVENLALVCEQILKKSVDYSLEVEEPKCSDNDCDVNFKVNIRLNENYQLFENYFKSIIDNIDLTEQDQKKYIDNGRKTMTLVYGKINSNGPKISAYHYLRNPESLKTIHSLFVNAYLSLFDFKISSDVRDYSIDIDFPMDIFIEDRRLWGADAQKSDVGNLLFGFPSATTIEIRTQGNMKSYSWGKTGLTGRDVGQGILMLPALCKINSDFAQLVISKKITLDEIGKISRFEIKSNSSN